MRAPDITYQYRMPIDTASPTFELYQRAASDTQSAVGVSVGFFGLPKDKVLVLSNAVIVANPGATIVVVSARMEFLSASGLNVSFAEFEQGVADRTKRFNWQGEIYVMGRGEDQFHLLFNATFSAATSGNFLGADVAGVVIPRANIASF